MKIFFISFCFILVQGLSYAQPLPEREDELVVLLDQLRATKNTASRLKVNQSFLLKFKETIEVNGAFNYPFSRLKTVGCITSPDNKVRIYNWNVEADNDSQFYFGFIQKYDDRKGRYQIFDLVDKGKTIPMKTNEVLDNSNWYGALYYKIVTVEKNKKTYYTLLGWDGKNPMSNLKVIDALHFSGGQAKFGAPIFRWNKESLNRVWFEYSKSVTMHLNYEEKYQRIIFDHLAPETPSLTGFYAMYVPDLSHDAMFVNDGKWYLVEDVIGVNAAVPEKLTIYVPNEKTGEIEEKKIKNKWLSPSKQHVAATPEMDGTIKTTNTAKEKTPKMKERKSKSPTSYNPLNEGKPKKKR